MLEKQLSTVFYPRLIANVLLGIIVTHLFRKALLAFSLHPPMPTFKWGQLLILLLTFASAYSFLTSYAVEILKLYDATRKVSLERRFLISLVIDTPIIFVWVSIYILWHYIEFTNSEAIQKVKLESLIKELQLKTIKSQMNPHFIFNALNSIRALVDEDPQRARQAITELSNILRSSIQADQSEVTSLDKELNILRWSNLFTFEGQKIEYTLGLVVEEERLLISYSTWDRTVNLGIYNKRDIENTLIKYYTYMYMR